MGKTLYKKSMVREDGSTLDFVVREGGTGVEVLTETGLLTTVAPTEANRLAGHVTAAMAFFKKQEASA